MPVRFDLPPPAPEAFSETGAFPDVDDVPDEPRRRSRTIINHDEAEQLRVAPPPPVVSFPDVDDVPDEPRRRSRTVLTLDEAEQLRVAPAAAVDGDDDDDDADPPVPLKKRAERRRSRTIMCMGEASKLGSAPKLAVEDELPEAPAASPSKSSGELRPISIAQPSENCSRAWGEVHVEKKSCRPRGRVLSLVPERSVPSKLAAVGEGDDDADAGAAAPSPARSRRFRKAVSRLRRAVFGGSFRRKQPDAAPA